MDPATIALLVALGKAAAGAAVGAATTYGLSQATPKHGMTQIGAVPEPEGVDFNALVGQQQQQESRLPQSRLQLRPF